MWYVSCEYPPHLNRGVALGHYPMFVLNFDFCFVNEPIAKNAVAELASEGHVFEPDFLAVTGPYCRKRQFDLEISSDKVLC